MHKSRDPTHGSQAARAGTPVTRRASGSRAEAAPRAPTQTLSSIISGTLAQPRGRMKARQRLHSAMAPLGGIVIHLAVKAPFPTTPSYLSPAKTQKGHTRAELHGPRLVRKLGCREGRGGGRLFHIYFTISTERKEGRGPHNLAGNPLAVLDLAEEGDGVHNVVAAQLPGVPVAEPDVRHLVLVAVVIDCLRPPLPTQNLRCRRRNSSMPTRSEAPKKAWEESSRP